MKPDAPRTAGCCAVALEFRTQARFAYARQRTGGPGSREPGRGVMRRRGQQPGAPMRKISRRSRRPVRDRITTTGTASIRA